MDYYIIERKLKNAFRKYGHFVARFPVAVFTVSVIISAGFAVGMLRFHMETDIETLYAPQGSQAIKDRDKIENIFPPVSSSIFLLYQQTRATLGANVILINSGNFKSVASLMGISNTTGLVRNMNFIHNSNSIKFDNICAKLFGACVTEGEFASTEEFHQRYLNGTLQYPIHTDQYGHPHDLRSFLGDVETANGLLKSFKAVRLSFYLQQDNATQVDTSKAWEDEFIKLMINYNINGTELAYQTSQSMNQELDQSTSGDFLFISLTFTVMITYACLVTTFLYRNSAMSTLATIGVMSIGLAVVASFGLISVCGLAFVNVVGVAPFLAVGKGIDDMFILLAFYNPKHDGQGGTISPTKHPSGEEMPNDNTPNGHSGTYKPKIDENKDGDKTKVVQNLTIDNIKPNETGETGDKKSLGFEEKATQTFIGEMFAEAGVAITVTTLTDVLAFGISASSNYVSVRTFCIYVGVVLLWCYFNIITIFGATVAFYTKKLGRKNCAPCWKSTKTDCDSSTQEYNKDSKLYNLFGNPVFRGTILVLFIGYLAGAIYGTTQMKQGLDLTNLVSDESYWRNYVTQNEKYFSERGPLVQFVIDGNLNYWESTLEKKVDNLIISAQNSKNFLNDSVVNWLAAYKGFLSGHPGGSNFTKADFVDTLRIQFLPNSTFEQDVVFSDDQSSIIASRVYVQGIGSPNNEDQVNLMKESRKLASESSLSVTAFTAPFVFFEQYVTILPATLQTCGIAVLAMFLVALIFVPHPLSSIYVTGTMMMILVGMTAFMHVWGLTLSSITMIQIVLSIGFSVDFSSHVCHVFVTTRKKLPKKSEEKQEQPCLYRSFQPNEGHSSTETANNDLTSGEFRIYRASETLKKIGIPIFNSGLSSILGVILLAFSNSYIFRSFFQTMFSVITLGGIHALLFLPVLLSLVGATCEDKKEQKEN